MIERIFLNRFHFRKIITLFSFLVISINCLAGDKSIKSYATTPWSTRMVESEMKRHPNVYGYWGYVTGTFLKSVEQLWRRTNNSSYYNYIRSTIDASIVNNGAILFYAFNNFSLDDINEGRILLLMYNQTKNQKYKVAADTLRKQLKLQPRTSEGGFWHRNNIVAGTYPHQMWLDGIYMANPFYAEYGELFNEPSDFDDVATQFTVMEQHARDPVTGLLYHGWDESKTQAWADPLTGCSQSLWGRAIGWYSMALVDVLDYLPENHAKRNDMIEFVKQLCTALKKYQHPIKGTWYQVVDKFNDEGNWSESSASCMFVYAIAKAVRMKYIDISYFEVAKKGYNGILSEFITTNTDSTINLVKTCSVAGLGGNPYRDGSYDYYVNQTTLSTNDGKGVSPFILASLEMENSGYLVPPLNISAKKNSNSSVTVTWNDRAYNSKGVAVQRKRSNESEFQEITRIVKGITSFTDSNLNSPDNLKYRLYAYNDSTNSDYSEELIVNSTLIYHKQEIENQFQLSQNYPNPFNPETKINYQISTYSKVSLKVYDVLGREIEALVDEYKFPGTYSASFNVDAHTGMPISGGLYFYKLSAGNFSSTKKMILLR